MKDFIDKIINIIQKGYKKATQELYLEDLFLLMLYLFAVGGFLTMLLLYSFILQVIGNFMIAFGFFVGFFGLFLIVRHTYRGQFGERLFVYQYYKYSRNKRRALVIIILVIIIYVPTFLGGPLFGISFSNGDMVSSLTVSLLLTATMLYYGLRKDLELNYLQDAIANVDEGQMLPEMPEYTSKETAEQALNLLHIYKSAIEAMHSRFKAEQMKTELIANVSHDLKTPLTSIVNYADLLLQEGISEEDEREYKEIVAKNANRMKVMINDLVFASKTGTGNVEIEEDSLEFNELILQSYSLLDSSYEEKNLQFVFESEEDDIEVLADGNQLNRIVTNLLSNAQKYSLSGTRVYGNTWFEDDKAFFTLKNISEEPLNMEVEELLSQFVRGDRSRHTEGSGLGLYIAQSLIDLMDGTLKLEIDGDLFKATIGIPNVVLESKEEVVEEEEEIDEQENSERE